MPSTNRARVNLLINYDPAKDAIYITAEKSMYPELAAGNLYITLKKNTHSEVLLRKWLTDKGVIQREGAPAVDPKQLRESGRLRSRDAKLLQLLARDGRSIMVRGTPEATLWATAVYANSGADPRVISIDPEEKPIGGLLSELLADIVSIVPREVNPDGDGGRATIDSLLASVYRQSPDFIVLNFHAGATNPSEVTPRRHSGFVYRVDAGSGRDFTAILTDIQNRGGDVDGIIFTGQNDQGEHVIDLVELVG